MTACAHKARIPWREVRIWSATEDFSTTFDEFPKVAREYMEHGSIAGWWLVDPSLYDNNCRPLCGYGPDLTDAGPKVSEIDWTGLAT